MVASINCPISKYCRDSSRARGALPQVTARSARMSGVRCGSTRKSGPFKNWHSAAWRWKARHSKRKHSPGEHERARSPEEIMAKLERKVGPEGRRIFERFLAQVARLQEKRQRELMGVEDDTEGDGSADEADASDAEERRSD
jgi:hypothetical protein